MEIIIRRSGGSSGDLSFRSDAPSQLTLAQLKQFVREQGGIVANRQLRFIYNGHNLNPEEDFSAQNLQGRERVYVHCFTGRILSPDELEREAFEDPAVTTPSAPMPAQPQGFDRLRGMGFSDQDVQVLRQQFTDLYGATGEEEQHTLEDLWIDNGDMSPYSSRLTDLLCILMGVFGGLWAVLLTRFNIFSKRQYATILFGVLINLMFSLLGYLGG